MLENADVISDKSQAGPKFGVLDIVEIHWPYYPDMTSEEGSVVQVRDYGAGRFRYAVGGDSELAGILDEDWLTAAGRRASLAGFWSGPLRMREIVKVSKQYPKPSLRGWYGEITSQSEGSGTSYDVTFTYGPFGAKSKIREIEARYLKPTGERLPPASVPYPVTHYASNGERGLRPRPGYLVVDDVEQYL